MTERPGRPSPLLEEITDLFGESVDLTKKELAHLAHLRQQVVIVEAYYIMMLRLEGQKSAQALAAQGLLIRRVREFVAHLESLGLDTSKLDTASAISALPFSKQPDIF